MLLGLYGCLLQAVRTGVPYGSGVNSDPADPAMRGGGAAGLGAQNSGKNFFTQQFAFTLGLLSSLWAQLVSLRGEAQNLKLRHWMAAEYSKRMFLNTHYRTVVI